MLQRRVHPEPGEPPPQLGRLQQLLPPVPTGQVPLRPPPPPPADLVPLPPLGGAEAAGAWQTHMLPPDMAGLAKRQSIELMQQQVDAYGGATSEPREPMPMPLRASPEQRRADPRQRRCSVAGVEDEPPLEKASDLPAWQLWARRKAEEHEAKVHARARHAGADRQAGKLPLWSTSQHELGAQFGVGAQLYFDLLRFCGFACFCGAFLSCPALVYNLYNPQGSNYELSEVDSTSWLAFTTAGARLNCDAPACRTLTAVLAVGELLYMLLLLAGLSRLRAHVRAVSVQMDRSQVSISDYSVELLGLPASTEAAEEALPPYALAKQRRLAARLALAELRLEQCAEFVQGQHHRIVDVQLMVSNGRVLQQGLRKAPLENAVEAAQRRQQRLLALEAAASSAWSRWRLAGRLQQTERDIERLALRLTHAREEILAFAADDDHKETVGAIVTFEHEEGRLECMRAYAPWRVPLWARDLLSLGVKDGFAEHASSGEAVRVSPIVARAVQEPSDLILHNIEHRGTLGNYCRQLASLLTMLAILATSCAIVAYSNLATELTTFDASVCGAYPVEWHDAAIASSAVCGTNQSWVESYEGEYGLPLQSALLRAYPAEHWDLSAEYAALVATTQQVSSCCDANGTNVTTNVTRYAYEPRSRSLCKDCYCASIVRLFWARNSTAATDVGATAWRRGGPYAARTISYCYEQLVLAPLVRWGSTLAILAMNGLIKVFVYEIGNFERKSSFTALTLSAARKLALYQYFNTGVVLLVVRGGLPSWLLTSDWHCWTSDDERRVCLFGDGESALFDAPWYRNVGGWLLLQMLLMIGTVNVFPYLRCALWAAKLRAQRGSVLTLSRMLKLYTGPRFPYAQRYGQVYCFMGLVLTYSSGMPMAYLLGLVFVVTTYATDKWAMLRLYRLPDRALDEQLMLASLAWWKYLLLVHACFAFWAFRALPDVAADGLHFMETALYNAFGKWPMLHPDEITFSTTLLFLLALALGLFQLSVCLRSRRGVAAKSPPPPSGAARRATARQSVAKAADALAGGGSEDARSSTTTEATAESGAGAGAGARGEGGARQRRSSLRAAAQAESGYITPDAADLSTTAEVAREKLRRARLDTELGELEGLPSFVDALHGCFHPTLRRVPQLTGAEEAVVHLHDVGRAPRLLALLNPMRCIFDAFGLDTSRHQLSWEEWVAAPRYMVHIQGEGKTSYSPDEHPNYRDAFLGSEELAENYRKLHAVRAGDSRQGLADAEGPLDTGLLFGQLGKSLRNLEADIFTKG